MDSKTKSPHTIYKYRDWGSKHGKDILEKFEFYFASPNQFNDPFDSKIQFDYTLMNDQERDTFIKNLMSAQKQKFDNMIPVIPESIRYSIIEKMVIENPEFFQINLGKLEHDLTDRVIGIISLTGKWDNLLMWAHYANNHKGYCIGFNEEKMRASGLFTYGGLVMYPEDREFPKIHPVMDENETFFKRTFTKSIDWKYEEEYRLLNIFSPENNNRTVKIDPTYIEEVILGLKISEKDESEILEICQRHQIKVFKVEPEGRKFALGRKIISE